MIDKSIDWISSSDDARSCTKSIDAGWLAVYGKTKREPKRFCCCFGRLRLCNIPLAPYNPQFDKCGGVSSMELSTRITSSTNELE